MLALVLCLPTEGRGTPFSPDFGGRTPSSSNRGYPHPVLTRGGGHFTSPRTGWGYPIQSWGKGVPPSNPDRAGVSPSSPDGGGGGLPPSSPEGRMVVSPSPLIRKDGGISWWGMGVPSIRKDGGTPPPPRTWWGTPRTPSADEGIPPPGCELTHKLKILPSPILRMRAVKTCPLRYNARQYDSAASCRIIKYYLWSLRIVKELRYEFPISGRSLGSQYIFFGIALVHVLHYLCGCKSRHIFSRLIPAIKTGRYTHEKKARDIEEVKKIKIEQSTVSIFVSGGVAYWLDSVGLFQSHSNSC